MARVEDTDNLGDRVRFLREQAGLSQEDLSKVLRVDRTVISNLEHGRRELRVEELLKLSQFLGVSPGQLLGTEALPEVALEPQKQVSHRQALRIHVPAKNVRKFKEALLYVLRRVGAKPSVGETVIYKILYFIDFDYYEKFKEQLIGATYVKNRHGPTPLEFQEVVREMIEDGEIERVRSPHFQREQKKYLPRRDPDLAIFSAQEMKTIDDVLGRLSDMNAAKISRYSHDDAPWLSTSDNQIIDYESVFYRTPAYSMRAD
jgi:transcriptional regulator with XRE-family HTH domain